MPKKARSIQVNTMADEFGVGIAIEKMFFVDIPALDSAILNNFEQAKQPHREDRHSFFLPESGTVQVEIDFQKFEGQGWRTAELLEEVQHSENFYFDKLCQIRMPSWTKGRVALIGDAAYCASPAAGMGGSLAMDGAATLADALQKHGGNYELAFKEYNQSLRPFIEQVQADAVKFGIESLVPRTEEAIRKRNTPGF